jgi:hypothetical protein
VITILRNKHFEELRAMERTSLVPAERIELSA